MVKDHLNDSLYFGLFRTLQRSASEQNKHINKLLSRKFEE